MEKLKKEIFLSKKSTSLDMFKQDIWCNWKEKQFRCSRRDIFLLNCKSRRLKFVNNDIEIQIHYSDIETGTRNILEMEEKNLKMLIL